MMHPLKPLSFLALILLLLATPAVPALAQGTGVLEGQVVNGTQGGPAIGAGVPVTLRVYDNGTETDVKEAVTAADGTFRFEGLATAPGTASTLEYWLEAVYQDVSYAAQTPYVFKEGQDTLTVSLQVYETTSDDSAVRIGSVHMIVESFGQALRVTEVHLLTNTGDRAFVGQPGQDGTPSTVFIPLPAGAVGLAFGEGIPEDRFVEVEGGLQDTEPVPPGGETSMAYFSYHLMVPTEGVELARQFSYPVDVLNILVSEPGLALESAQLESRGSQAFQDRQYGFYATADLAADTPVVMNLIPVAGAETTTGGMPGSETPPEAEAPVSDTPPAGSVQGALRWLGLALSLAAVIAAFVYPTVARRTVPARAPAPDLTNQPRTRELLAELAELEKAYQAGTLDDDEYERERARLYGALRS